MKNLVFIPMYNCEKQITRVLSQFDEEVCKYISEIIIVNNRSTDNGEQAVMEYIGQNTINANIKLLRNRENYSLGGSHKVAFKYAIQNQFDYIIVLHGDDQGDIHDIIPYLKNNRAYKYDSILGSRFDKNSKLTNYSKFRIIGNRIFNIFMTVSLRHRVSDLGSGLNMYKVEYLKNEFYKFFPNNLTFNVYMLIYGVYSKSKFYFFPLSWREDDQVSNAKFLKQSLEIFRLTLSYIVKANRVFSLKANQYSRISYQSDEIR